MTEILEFLSGLGLFLYAMKQLERALKLNAEYRLQKRLADNTGSSIEAILTGTVSTAILQSSSLVGLIVLALCAAGFLPLINAIGVMVGANLGTTFTGWIVTFIGFKLNLTAFAFYFIGLAGLVHIFSPSNRLKNISTLIIAIGLLLLGLDLMKNSAAGISELIDIETFKAKNMFFFLLVGIFLSAVIQSSSAVMMITLSALHINIIEIQQAAALIIGADLGTTSTVMLGSIKGASIKRQLAMAHLIFNLVTDLIAFIFLLPILPDMLSYFGITDPLYSLVVFHSLFNFVGILIFLPLMKPFARMLENKFQEVPKNHAHFIHNIPTEVPEIAIQALKKEVKELIQRAIKDNIESLLPKETKLFDAYHHLKSIEGEILAFNRALQKRRLSDENIKQLSELNQAVRLAIFSVKSLNDVEHDVEALYLPHIDSKAMAETKELIDLYSNILSLLETTLDELNNPVNEESFEQLSNSKVDLKVQWLRNQEDLSNSDVVTNFDHVEISSLLNLNREIYNSGKHLINSVKFLLQSQQT